MNNIELKNKLNQILDIIAEQLSLISRSAETYRSLSNAELSSVITILDEYRMHNTRIYQQITTLIHNIPSNNEIVQVVNNRIQNGITIEVILQNIENRLEYLLPFENNGTEVIINRTNLANIILARDNVLHFFQHAIDLLNPNGPSDHNILIDVPSITYIETADNRTISDNNLYSDPTLLNDSNTHYFNCSGQNCNIM